MYVLELLNKIIFDLSLSISLFWSPTVLRHRVLFSVVIYVLPLQNVGVHLSQQICLTNDVVKH